MISLYFPDAHGMALGVSVFDIDRRGKGVHRLFVDRAQAVVQTLVLVRLVFHFLQQTMTVNADADVARQRAENL